ncbi:HAMP domain-containing sensor histidine kinase, partial [Ilumatobacter nonamiensis]|uniref:HAMP domain-containing sensor histidine kinase n=1 Tax=Ilumatobacter nonamiensis TaxID=467093 RepID=UPI000684C0B3
SNDNDSNDNDSGGSDSNDENRRSFDPDSIVQTLDETGTVDASSGAPLPVGDKDVEISSGDSRSFRDVTVDGEEYRMITAPTDGGGAVQVATRTSSNSDVLSRLKWRLAGVGAILAATAAALGWFLMRRTTEPLAALTEATERVATGTDLTPLDLDRDDEVGRLADSFDRMLAALALSREQQRRLVQDAAHELRTPLTSLRTNIELLARAPDLPPDEHAALMAALTTEVAELGELFGEIVELASDPTAPRRPDTTFDMATVVENAAERFRVRTGRTIEIRTEPTELTGDPTAIDRAVTNLFSNADKFSPSTEPIEVVLDERRLVVRDHGPGIAADDESDVFDRFYRAPSARSTPGSGLGLAIVRQIAEQHGGSAFAGTRDDGGAEVGFSVGNGWR